MHLVGFTIETYYDARPCERQICILHVVIENTAHLYAWCIIFVLLENARKRYVPQKQDTDCRIQIV